VTRQIHDICKSFVENAMDHRKCRKLIKDDVWRWDPSNTMWPGPRPTLLPSGILIHPAVIIRNTVGSFTCIADDSNKRRRDYVI